MTKGETMETELRDSYLAYMRAHMEKLGKTLRGKRSSRCRWPADEDVIERDMATCQKIIEHLEAQ